MDTVKEVNQTSWEQVPIGIAGSFVGDAISTSLTGG